MDSIIQRSPGVPMELKAREPDDLEDRVKALETLVFEHSAQIESLRIAVTELISQVGTLDRSFFNTRIDVNKNTRRSRNNRSAIKELTKKIK